MDDTSASEHPRSAEAGADESATPESDATLPAPSSMQPAAAMAPTLPPTPGQPSAQVTLPANANRGEDLDKLPKVDGEFYSLGAEIARGGMGRILYARDRRVGRPVAIKELLSSRPVAVARFLREATLTARLQHPGIIPVYEAGRWDDGSPFIAMKLVEGRPLNQLIVATKNDRERIALLPNLIAVADAVAYAHSRGVIHRDLKPANILVGKYGETVIIDWGLGKKIGDDGKADLATSIETPQNRDLTMAGATMGTPAYMAPQQAEGVEVDERADVYALGAILYHLLAGQAPYQDSKPSDAEDAVAKVLAGPPRPLAELATGAPEELVAVVDKAMARQISDRYATAGALAEDLRRFQTGQLVGAHAYSPGQLVKRWVGKHRAPVAVAGIAILVLLVLGAVSVQRIRSERSHAEAQERIAVVERSAADHSRTEVEKLLDFMLVDLRRKLKHVGKLELLDMVADRAAEYYEQRRGDDSPEDAARRAAAFDALAMVAHDRGNFESARRQHGKALAIREGLVERSPDDVDALWALSTSLYGLGDSLLAQGAVDQATTHHRRCLELRVRLAEAEPDNSTFAHGQAASHGRIAAIHHATGDLDGALAEYQRALDILGGDDAAASSPGWQRSLAATHTGLGVLQLIRGKPAAALGSFRAATVILEALIKTGPSLPLLRDLAIVRTNIGDILLSAGKVKRALAAYQNAEATLEQAHITDPSNANWQRELAAAKSKVGVAFQFGGQLEASIAKQRDALAHREALLERNPSSARAKTDLANSYVVLASTLASNGRSEASLPLAKRAAELYATSATDAAELYNAVCANALAGDKDQAFAMLDKCLAGGYGDRAALESDPDLASLRKDPRWKVMMERLSDKPASHDK